MKLSEFSPYLKEELSPLFSEREASNLISILFDYYLGLSRTSQLLAQDRILSESEITLLQNALGDLKKHKPIDYVINQSIFFGYEFFVDDRVLIPRSETEELVQWILENETDPMCEILDIGSGSGCIPITLDLEGDYKRVDACEVSEAANEVARINAKNLHSNVTFEKLDILSQVPSKKYDIVVSNPPYVKKEELHTLDKNVVDYEPGIALAPEGNDPLLFYKRMIVIAPQMLKKDGRLYWEIHEDLGKEVLELLENASFNDVELKQDLYGRDRLVRAKVKG